MKHLGLVLAVLLACMNDAKAQATTLWVDGVNGDDANLGLSSEPFKTINKAIDRVVALSLGAAIIKVQYGLYDWTHENAYTSTQSPPRNPFPILLPTNTDILGADLSSQSTWPRIGGGVNTSTVEALLLVEATTDNRIGVDLKNLYFVGEVQTGKDGPAALCLRTRNGYSASIDVDTCYFERPGMDDSSQANRPTVFVDMGWGQPTLTIQNCTVRPSALGGIVATVGPDTTSTRVAEPNLYILDNTITASGSELADHGIALVAFGDRYLTTDECEIRGNTVTSAGANAGYGITTGIYVSVDPANAAFQTIDHGTASVRLNKVLRCLGDGIWIQADVADANSSAHIALIENNFERNEIRDCGASGLRIDRGDDFGGYLNIEVKGCLIVNNDRGITMEGLDASAGSWLLNNTIASSHYEGLYIRDAVDNAPVQVVNNIVYFNNGGGIQHGGTVSWDPFAPASFQHNVWQGYTYNTGCNPASDTAGKSNVGGDPGFVDEANGNFHLTSSACARNKGDNTPDGQHLTESDIDGQRRIANDDDDIVDIGADEYLPGA